MTTTQAPVAAGTQRICPVCGTVQERFAPGPGGRPDASCPSCRSLERHRFLALLLEGLGPAVTSARLAVEVAPTPVTTDLFRRLAPQRLLRLDFDPAADDRRVDVQASITDAPLRDGSVDLLVCYHVLEHVPDDAAAIAEIARVLSPGGLGLLQVPWRPDRATDEDPAAPEEERVRRFGQADHVRYYGADFDDRLAAGGLSFTRFTPYDVLGPELCALFRLIPSETVWAVRPAGGAPPRTSDGLHLAARSIRALERWHRESVAATAEDLRRITDERDGWERRAREQERAARHWEKAYRSIRDRLPVRAAAALRRRARALRARLPR